ncbi:hypothetical protein ACS0TY_005521 [Phlomoides rotata]
MTVFLRTDMGVDIVHANNYLGALFYSLLILLFDGMPELSLTVAKLVVFYRQRDFHFYLARAYAIPATILKIPLSFLQALLWTSLTYFVIGYTPDVGSTALCCAHGLDIYVPFPGICVSNYGCSYNSW